jgi:hypothetical protein
MRQSVRYPDADGPLLVCKAPESVLPLCETILLSAGPAPLDAATRARLQRAQDDMAEAGLRVIAGLPPPACDCPPGSEEQALALAAWSALPTAAGRRGGHRHLPQRRASR